MDFSPVPIDRLAVHNLSRISKESRAVRGWDRRILHLRQMSRAQPQRLAPEVNRILFVRYESRSCTFSPQHADFRNLPYKITSEEMYDLFGKYGAVRQIRMYHSPRFIPPH
jgi:hypothetical protein